MNNATCEKCGKQYRMGFDGITKGCDECFGIQRDKTGEAWYPGEKTQTRLLNDGKTKYIVTRKQAFSK